MAPKTTKQTTTKPSKPATPSSATANNYKAEDFRKIREKYKQHFTSSEETTPDKKLKEEPGNRAHLIFTDTTHDGRDCFYVTHRSNPGPAYMIPFNTKIQTDPKFREALGIERICCKVSPADPNAHYAAPYTNKNGVTRNKMWFIYFRKYGHSTSPEKREKWIRNAILPLWNEYGKKKHNLFAFSDEQFDYGGDLAVGRGGKAAFLADYLTLDETQEFMILDYGQQPNGFSIKELMSKDDMLSLFFGPQKKPLMQLRHEELNEHNQALQNFQHNNDNDAINNTFIDKYTDIPGYTGYNSD